MTAAQVAQTSNPKILVEKRWNRARLEIGSNFKGNVDVDAAYHKDGTFTVKGSGMIDSDVGGVVGAEGVRATQLTPLMTEQMRMVEKLDAGLTRRHEIVGENMQAAGHMMALAATAGGDALKKVIDATAPILAGSGGSLDLGTLGSGSFNLGTGNPSPAPTVSPPPGSIVTRSTTPTTTTTITETGPVVPAEAVQPSTAATLPSAGVRRGLSAERMAVELQRMTPVERAAFLNNLNLPGVRFDPPGPPPP